MRKKACRFVPSVGQTGGATRGSPSPPTKPGRFPRCQAPSRKAHGIRARNARSTASPPSMRSSSKPSNTGRYCQRVARRRSWLQEERRRTLGDWVALCLGCGHVQRYFEDTEGGLPPNCPQCGRPLLHRCPGCSARMPRRLRSSAKSAASRSAQTRASARGSGSRAARRGLISEKRITVTVSSSRDVTVVELAEEGRHLLGAPDLRVVVLDLAGRHLGRASSPRPCRSRRRRRAREARSARRRAPARPCPSCTSATCPPAGSSPSCGASAAGRRRGASRS